MKREFEGYVEVEKEDIRKMKKWHERSRDCKEKEKDIKGME